jgi:NAD+ kinase
VNGENLPKSVGLVARYDKKESLELAERLVEYLQARKIEVYLEDTLKGKLSAEGKYVSLKSMKTDFIITIGGDGTILRTCMKLPKPEPPILAINMSIRGFLTAAEPKQAFDALDKCLAGKFTVEKCMKLAATAESVEFPDALNEVLILASEPSKLLYTHILKNKKPILTCQADGLIISTQTGSTGYSLSAGGSVLDPKVNAFILAPICALSPFKPIVFPADSTLTVKIDKPNKVFVIVDGHFQQTISSKNPTITVMRSKHETSFIRFEENFYDRLKSRLLFQGNWMENHGRNR